MKTLFFALILFISNVAYAAPVTLAGDEIDAAMIRTIDQGYGLGRITGYGLDAPFIVQDGSSDERQYSAAFKLNVDGNGFYIRFLDISGWQDGTVLRMSDLDFSIPGSVLSSIGVDTNLVGYTLAVGTDTVDIGLGGTSFTADTYFSATFNVSSLPEPASLCLVSIGLLAAAVSRRKIRIKN